MSGSLCNSLNSDNIIFSRTNTIEGMEDYTAAELRAMKKDKAFMHIWNGGVIRASLTIRSMTGSDEKGQLILNGRRFTRSSWDWRPPAIIRDQGRLAKEVLDPVNDHPEIPIITQRGEVLWLDSCPCGGELVMDHRGYLYCTNCFIIYE